MGNKKLLVIGHVWPEPTSSAAGWRMLQLLDIFDRQGYQIHFATAASRTEYAYPLLQKGIEEHAIKLNDRSFDLFVKEMCPDVVMFDRFMVEEQYGWRVAENAPNAVRVLDTEDLHFLRAARQEAFRQKAPWRDELLYSTLAKREIASILRSDLSILISKEEEAILKDKFGISDKLLYWLPFLSINETRNGIWLDYDQRMHFVFIGNFLHEPNWQTVQLLKTVYWPLIRQQLPKVELHIYGAYPSLKVLQLHQPKDGFHIKGRADDAVQTLAQYRVLLAPIPFGAGLKGKFVDSWHAGTPSMTTTIGAEGLASDNWPGAIEDDPQLYVEKAVALYREQKVWRDAQSQTKHLLAASTASEKEADLMVARVEDIADNLQQHRQHNFIGQILQSQQLNATKYMSLWIEQKNKGNNR